MYYLLISFITICFLEILSNTLQKSYFLLLLLCSGFYDFLFLDYWRSNNSISDSFQTPYHLDTKRNIFFPANLLTVRLNAKILPLTANIFCYTFRSSVPEPCFFWGWGWAWSNNRSNNRFFHAERRETLAWTWAVRSRTGCLILPCCVSQHSHPSD